MPDRGGFHTRPLFGVSIKQEYRRDAGATGDSCKRSPIGPGFMPALAAILNMCHRGRVNRVAVNTSPYLRNRLFTRRRFSRRQHPY